LSIRPYDDDYPAISDFLVDTYEPGDVFANWLQPRWEYMGFEVMFASDLWLKEL
jgi:hypothetical protein